MDTSNAFIWISNNLIFLGPGGSREGNILESLVKNAEQRELLISMLAKDKERYRQEDKEIEMKMAEQGIRYGFFKLIVLKSEILLQKDVK